MLSENSPQLLTPRETGKMICISPGTLAIWRCTKRYPLKYIKVGGRVFYRLKDILSFLESRTR